MTVESPKRVAALIGSFADVWCLAGGKDTLVAAADDTWTQFELGLPETVVNLGGVKEPSAEALLAAQPDFVIGSAKTAADVDLLPTALGDEPYVERRRVLPGLCRRPGAGPAPLRGPLRPL
mgnify:CR=1 FL=1